MSSLPQNISNFRDVGKTVNDFLGKKLIREGVLFRSAAPDRASPQDQEYLRSSLGIHTIVDFRSRTEILKARQKAENSNGTKQPPHSIPGIQYHDIQVTGRAFENRLLSFLSWWQYFQVIYLYMFGYRVDAVRLVSRAVMVPRGLIGLAGDTIDCSGPALCEALSLLADSETTPALVHCTHGKDRTGLIYALVLMILDVPVDAIEHDYFLSDKLPEVELQKRVRDVREIGLADDWSRTASTLIPFITTHIKEEYGDLNSYLDLNGFDSAQRTKLRDLLLY